MACPVLMRLFIVVIVLYRRVMSNLCCLDAATASFKYSTIVHLVPLI